MNADTGEFRALTEQVAAVGRKMSALTGRVTVMGNHLNRLDGLVHDDLEPIARLYGYVTEDLYAQPARHEAPKGKRARHLRAVD